MFRTLIAALALAVAATIPAVATTPPVSLQLKQQVLGSNTAAKPGTVIRYTIVATNSSNAIVKGLMPVGPVPAHTQFRSAAPVADAVTEYTIDNKTWSAQPMVRKTVDGVARLVPAPASAYEGIRWKLKTPLQPHASASFVYEVLVK